MKISIYPKMIRLVSITPDEKMQLKPAECIVIEDALHAVSGAKKAGCYVVAVKEKSQQKDEEKIRSMADAYIEDMQELEEILCRKF